ncbi:MAG: nucleotidyltransferase domain-containing protein [Dehalococcoidia bacterium]
MLTDAQIAALLRDAIPGLIAVYRFGSTARGQTHAGSDVDVAFLAAAPVNVVDRFAVQERLAARLGRDVDLVDLGRASTVMRMQVVSTGVLLAAIDTAAQERFEDLTYSGYARLNEERREILEQIHREGRVHGG